MSGAEKANEALQAFSLILPTVPNTKLQKKVDSGTVSSEEEVHPIIGTVYMYLPRVESSPNWMQRRRRRRTWSFSWRFVVCTNIVATRIHFHGQLRFGILIRCLRRRRRRSRRRRGCNRNAFPEGAVNVIHGSNGAAAAHVPVAASAAADRHFLSFACGCRGRRCCRQRHETEAARSRHTECVAF